MHKWILMVSLLLTTYASYANEAIEQTLDAFHQAAAEANYEKYFSLLAKEGVFLGTDATERWTKEEFSKYVKPYFSQGKGWRYLATKRNISVIEGSNYAFFDELLENDYYGQCRGSGVLVYQENQWRLLQYNLSVMVPNQLSNTIVSLIKDAKKESNE